MLGHETSGGGSLYATDWQACAIDGEAGAPPEEARPGLAWSWHGEVWRLDAGPGPLRLDGAIGRAALHRVAASRAARLLRRPASIAVVGQEDLPRPVSAEGPAFPGDIAPVALLRDGLTVTDGHRTWAVHPVLDQGEGRGLALFSEGVPPPGRDLWLVTCVEDALKPEGPAVMGFGLGTMIQTPRGPAPVEALRPGDPVLTDQGVQPVRAVRVRPAAASVLVPAHLWAPEGAGPESHQSHVLMGRGTWIGVEEGPLGPLLATGEAVVRAGDLDLLPGVRARRAVDLVALTLAHGPSDVRLIMAGGMPCLAGPPACTALRRLSAGEAQILFGPRALRPAPVLRGAA